MDRWIIVNYKHFIIGFCMLFMTVYVASAIEYDITEQTLGNYPTSINGSHDFCGRQIWVNGHNGNLTANITDCNNFSIYYDYGSRAYEDEYEVNTNTSIYTNLGYTYLGRFGLNNTNDSVGNVADANRFENPSNTWYISDICQTSNCLMNNGKDEHFYIASKQILLTENATVCIDVRYNTTSGGSEKELIDAWTGSIQTFILRLSTTNKMALYSRDGGNTRVSTGTTTFIADKWYQICFTYNGTDDVARLYVDGIQEANYTHTSGSRSGLDQDTWVFGSNDGNSNFMNGTIDNIMFIEDTLSDFGIQELYNNTFLNNSMIPVEVVADIIPPIVTVDSPINDTYNYTTIPLNVYADEPIHTWWYILNNGSETIFTPNTTINASNGSNEITVFANDTYGNVNNGSIVFFASDTDDPNVNIHSPLNITYDANILNLEVSADENISAWWYNLNYGVDIAFSPNTTINATEGQNALFVYANDSVLNTGFNSVFFVVDTTAPTFDIIEPQNTTYINVTTVDLSINYTELTAIFSYSLNSADFVEFIPNTTISALNGSNEIIVRGNDTNGNYQDQTVYFNVVYPPPSEPTEFTGYSIINLNTLEGVLIMGILVFFYMGLWVIGFYFRNFGFCSMGFIVGFFLGFLFFNIHWVLTGMMFLLNCSIFITSAKTVK